MEPPFLPSPDDSRYAPSTPLDHHLPLVLVIVLANDAAQAELAALSAQIGADSGQTAYLFAAPSAEPGASARLLAAAAESSLPASTAQDGQPLSPGTLYIAPDDALLTLHDGNFTVAPLDRSQRTSLLIETLLDSVAKQQGRRAIVVHLAAGAEPSVAAVQSIRDAGGIALLVQARVSQPGPVATLTNHYDGVVSTKALPAELLRLTNGLDSIADARISQLDADSIQPVLTLIRNQLGYNLSGYLLPNLALCIYRRMLVRSKELPAYYSLLQTSTAELETLGSDILSPYTRFFRDPACWEALDKELSQRLATTQTVRIWSAGCSSGEEAYSLAILLLEHQERSGLAFQFTIFATDICTTALLTGRDGVYGRTLEQELAPERLQKFFHKSEDRYRVAKELRDRCVFLNHNLCFDPPLANIDLLLCRNTIRYFGQTLQEQAIVNISQALAPQGICMLGLADPTDLGSQLFQLQHESRLYLKTLAPMHLEPAPNMDQQPVPAPLAEDTSTATTPQQTHPLHPIQAAKQIQQQADAIVAARFGPPGLVVDEELTVIEIRGEITPFVQVSPGLVTGKLSQLLQPRLSALIVTLIEASALDHTTSQAETVVPATSQRVSIEVTPLATDSTRNRAFLVLLQSPAPPNADDQRTEAQQKTPAPTAPLPQSATALPDPLPAFVASMDTPMLLLNDDRSIRLFTPSMADILGLAPSDIGLDASTLNWNLTHLNDLRPLLDGVLDTRQPHEQEVQDRDQHWFRLILRPWLDAQNLLGLIILLVDIDTERTLREQLLQARDFASCVLQQIPVPLAVLHADLRFRSTNAAFRSLAGAVHQRLEDWPMQTFSQQFWGVSADAIELHKLQSLPVGGLIETEFSTRSAPGKILVLKAQVLQSGAERVVLLVVEDVTLRRETERLLARQQTALTDQLENRDTLLKVTQKELHDLAQHLFTVQEQERERIASELHDDVSQRLSLLLLACNRLAQLPHTPPEALEIDSILQQVQSLASDVRVMSHNLHPALLKQLGLVAALKSLVDDFREKENLPATLNSGIGELQPSDLAATTCYRIVQESLRNVAKHAGRTHVKISLDTIGTLLRLQIRDFGNGFDQNSPFPHQGLGLTSMRERTRIAGGTFAIVSTLGEGTTIVAEVPSGVDV